MLYGLLGCFIEMICSVGIRGEGIRHFLNRVVYDTIYEQSIPGNRPLWFLLTLYLVIVVANYLLPKFHPLLVAIGSFACAYIVYKLHLDFSPWILGNLPAGLCFYALGYWMHNKENKYWAVLISIFVYVVILLAPAQIPNMVFHAHTMNAGNYMLFYPFALASIILCNNVFRWLTPIFKFRILTHIGLCSMNYYITHWILLIIVATVYRDILHFYNSKVLFWILVASCVVILPWVNRLIQYVESIKPITRIWKK